MNKCLFYLAMTLVLAMAGKANAQQYTVTGLITGAGDGIAVLEHRDADREITGRDTVCMKNGRFYFIGTTPEIRRVGLSIIVDGREPVTVPFWLENSEISIMAEWTNINKGGNEAIAHTHISGSSNQALVDLLAGAYDAVLELPEFAGYNPASRTREADCTKAALSLQKKIIRENGSSVAAGFYLYLLKAKMPLTELEDLFNTLDEAVRNNPYVTPIAEEIAIQRAVAPGNFAPDFTLETPDGGYITLSDLKGKIVILDFWASWCQPCRASFPEMKVFHENYRGMGVEIIGISTDQSRTQWLNALEKDQLPWPQAIDANVGRNGNSVAKSFAERLAKIRNVSAAL